MFLPLPFPYPWTDHGYLLSPEGTSFLRLWLSLQVGVVNETPTGPVSLGFLSSQRRGNWSSLWSRVKVGVWIPVSTGYAEMANVDVKVCCRRLKLGEVNSSLPVPNREPALAGVFTAHHWPWLAPTGKLFHESWSQAVAQTDLTAGSNWDDKHISPLALELLLPGGCTWCYLWGITSLVFSGESSQEYWQEQMWSQRSAWDSLITWLISWRTTKSVNTFVSEHPLSKSRLRENASSGI